MTALDRLLDGRRTVWLVERLREEGGVVVTARALSYYRTGQRALPRHLIDPIARVVNEDAVKRRRERATS
jgi:hypothetical protein